MAAMKKVKSNDVVRRKKAAMKKPAKAAMKKIFTKKPAQAAKKTNTKAKAKNSKSKWYSAEFVEALNTEFIVHTTDSSTETLCKVYYSKERKGLEFRYYKSFRPA